MQTKPYFPLPGGPFVPEQTRRKGRALFEAGAAIPLGEPWGEGEVWGQRYVVEGGEPYDVWLHWTRHEWDGNCTCIAFARWGPCKHMQAAVLDFCARESLGSKEMLVRYPVGGRQEEAWQEELEELAELARAGLVGSPASGPTDADATARVDLVLERPGLEVEGPIVHPVLRSRRKDGSWGLPLGLDDSRRRLEGLSREDVELVRLLSALERFEPFGRPGYAETSMRLLSGGLAASVLAGAARRGRLHLFVGTLGREDPWRFDLRDHVEDALHGVRGGEVRGTRLLTLGVDDGAPWRRELVVEAGSTRGQPSMLLRQRFRRGTERLDADEIRCTFEGAALFVHGRDLARFGAEGAFTGLELLLDPDERPVVPPEDAAEFASRLAPLVGPALVEAPDLRHEHRAPTPVLAVQGFGERSLDWSLHARYGDTVCPALESHPRMVRVERGVWAPRDDAAEREALQRLADLNVFPDPRVPYGREGTFPARRLAVVAGALVAEGWEVRVDGTELRAPQSTSLRVTSGQDWFDLEGGADFGGAVVPAPELLEAARRPQAPGELGRLLELDDGSLGLLPEEWLERWRALALGERRGDALRFHHSQGVLLDALFAAREDELSLEADAGFRGLRERLEGFAGARPAREHRRFQGTLRGYQRAGLGWLRALRSLELGGCLADEMGLGKTVQVLAHVQKLRASEKRGERRPTLVVAPRSLVFQWAAEAERFAPELTVVDHVGTKRAREASALQDADLILTTYGTLRRDAELLASLALDTAVLDEATAIKNATSQTAKAARLLRARHRLALTGTPVENHLGELWSLFEFLNPGLLGRSGRFRELLGKGRGEAQAGSGFLEAVGQAVAPFLLRRRKEDVLKDLPEKSVETLTVELGRAQRKEYDRLRDHYRSVLLEGDSAVADGEDGLSGQHVLVLEALLRLRQASCHLGLIDQARRDDASAKLEALFEQLQPVLDTPGRKALIFSQFTSLLDLVRAEVEARDIPYCLLTGRTRKRAEAVERFQRDPDVPLFLISLKAGGHGLNLTAADTVFLLDPWWNPAVEAQAIDRVHRTGQTRPVIAYRLIARDTVEEKVLALQQDKQALADSVLGDERSLLAQLTREDLAAIL